MYEKFLTNCNTDIVVIYHGSCPDGACAAWCFRKYINLNHKNISESKIDFYPAEHGKQNIPNCKDKLVFILDFTYEVENMKKIVMDSIATFVIDHHDTGTERIKTVRKEYKCVLKLFTYIDLNRSGCQLTWDILFREKRPWFVDYVGDRDLWQWKLPNSKEINCALFVLYKHDKIEAYDKLELESDSNLIEKGKICLEYENNIVEQLKVHCQTVSFEGYKVNIASCPYMFISELGNRLVTSSADFAAIYTYVPCKLNKDNSLSSSYFSISLRGLSEKNIDLSKIAEKYKGGGHKLACGFKWYGKLEDLFNFEI